MKAMLQRDFALFKRGLIPALVLTLLLALSAALAGYAVSRMAGEGARPVKVAVVDEEGGLVSTLAIRLVSSQDSIASLMDLQETKKQEALDGLAAGRYAAVMILPDGYTDRIRSGQQGEGEILLSRAAASSFDVVSSLASFGELLLAAGQNAVFAGEALLRRHQASEAFYQAFLDKSNANLMDSALKMYHNGIRLSLSVYQGSGLSLSAYFAVAWLSFFMLLCGLFFPALYGQDCQKSMLARLYSVHIGPREFLGGKLLYPLVFRAALLMPALIALSRFLPLSINIPSLIFAAAALILASGYITFSAVILSASRGWQGLLTALAVLGLFLCGGLIPRGLLPPWILTAGRFSPFGAVFAGLAPLFGAEPDIAVLLTGFGCLFALGLLCCRRLRQLPAKGEDL